MHFTIVGELTQIETIATGSGNREIARLRKLYGRGRWRKRKGIADIRSQTSLDLHHYRSFLAEGVVYRYEGKRIEGRSALIEQALRKVSSVDAYSAESRRISVVGNIVLNDRVDVFTMHGGQQVRLNVTSVFLVADGKIVEWREYPQP